MRDGSIVAKGLKLTAGNRYGGALTASLSFCKLRGYPAASSCLLRCSGEPTRSMWTAKTAITLRRVHDEHRNAFRADKFEAGEAKTW